jgi:hypothetical protein
MNQFTQKMYRLEKSFKEGEFDDFYNTFVKNFYEAHNIVGLFLTEGGFSKGDADIDDLVDLKNTLNRMYGDDEPAVYFELDDDDQICTDIYDFLDSKFTEQCGHCRISWKKYTNK